MIAVADVSGDGRVVHLVVTDPSGPATTVDVAAIWLRDACVCSTCRRPATDERRLDTVTIDPDVRVSRVHGDGASVLARTSDDHDVVVPVDRIAATATAGDRPVATGPAAPDTVVGAAEPVHVAATDLNTDLGGVLDVLARDGALVVEGIDPSDDGLRSVATRIAPIHATNYGTTWSIDAVVEPVSEVESSRGLLVHTDLPYRTDPPGVQLLLACHTEVRGGASTLVDGMAAAERLRRHDPASFELLATVPVEFPYRRADTEIVGWAPLIELAHDRTVRVIRRAPDLVGSPRVTIDEADRWFAALRCWSSMLDDPATTVTVPLRTGELLLFDNHRMLHGRTAFELGANGRRVLRGCYLHRDDVTSRRAVLGRRS